MFAGGIQVAAAIPAPRAGSSCAASSRVPLIAACVVARTALGAPTVTAIMPAAVLASALVRPASS
jgi:hypothetical protein